MPGPPRQAGPVSRRSEIRAMVLDRISAGDWRPGGRIPSEHELMEVFGVSRMTVHSALTELARDGVLHRIKGLGTFVAPPRSHLTVVHVGDPAEDIRARGGVHSCEIVANLERRGTMAELGAFRLASDASLFHLVAVHRENGAPVVLEDRLVNPALAPDFLQADFTRITAFAYLMSLSPYPEGRHVIRAVEATERLRTLLNLQPGEPCLEIERTTWVPAGVMTLARLYHPGLRFELTGDIERR